MRTLLTGWSSPINPIIQMENKTTQVTVMLEYTNCGPDALLSWGTPGYLHRDIYSESMSLHMWKMWGTPGLTSSLASSCTSGLTSNLYVSQVHGRRTLVVETYLHCSLDTMVMSLYQSNIPQHLSLDGMNKTHSLESVHGLLDGRTVLLQSSLVS